MSSINFNFHYPKFAESIAVYFLLQYRKWKYGYPFRKIKLTKGKYTIVDQADFKELSKYKWYAIKTTNNNFYAARKMYRYFTILMHRQIVQPATGYLVDHINHNGLDNRRANLRPATLAQNNRHSRKRRDAKSSRYKGVCRITKGNKWIASINYEGRKIHLGTFDNETDAGKAYDEGAKKYFGEFAVLNFKS